MTKGKTALTHEDYQKRNHHQQLTTNNMSTYDVKNPKSTD